MSNVNSVDYNMLEQVEMNMPEARFYFAGDKEQVLENVHAQIDQKELTPQSLQKFSETGEGICYYVMLDVSASISHSEFAQIRDALAEFYTGIREQDKVVCMTFGDEVKTVVEFAGTQLSEEGLLDEFCQITNPDMTTLLFEGMHQMAKRAEADKSDMAMRQVAYVITDGEDFSTGKSTSAESLKQLQKAGIPVYGFVSKESEKEYVNNFGEYVRATGGNLTLFSEVNCAEAFAANREDLYNSYEAIFTASSNRVADANVTATLQCENGVKQQKTVFQNRWQADTEAPYLVSAEMINEKQMRVKFSEAVEGAQSTQNYVLHCNGKDYIPVSASWDSAQETSLLTFSADLESGDYTLGCMNITDCSMEKNLITEAAVAFQIEAQQETEAETEAETEQTEEQESEAAEVMENNLQEEVQEEVQEEIQEEETEVLETEEMTQQPWDPWVPYAAGATGLLLLIILFLLSLKKKRRKDDRIVKDIVVPVNEQDPAATHVILETKDSKKKTVFLRIAGQKDELELTVYQSMVVGRSKGCELHFDDQTISRQQFAFSIENSDLMIKNLSQSNPTKINGVTLGDNVYKVFNGDTIKAGKLVMTIRWDE